jgi:cytochrome c oxidase assembly protein subunit 15
VRFSENIWLHRFATLTALATLFLICLGGLVTSHGVGMSVPDWPTTYGYNMFFFPISKWVGGILYEHSHRLVASAVGMLTVVLAVWLALKEKRAWLRTLGWLAVVAVVLQGVLGGLRVTALKDEIGIFHATLAQLFLVLVSAIALFTSRWWLQSETVRRIPSGRSERLNESGTSESAIQPQKAALGVDGVASNTNCLRPLRPIYCWVSALILVQLILGATMRHQHAGLAIPDFPAAYGKLWPDTDAASVARYNQARGEVTALNPITAFQIRLQMAHRIAAAIILVAVAWTAVLTGRRLGLASALSKLAIFWLVLIVLQAGLGMATIWTNKSADIATAHVAIGALSLVAGAFLALMSGQCDGVEVRPAQISDAATIRDEVRSRPAHLPA